MLNPLVRKGVVTITDEIELRLSDVNPPTAEPKRTIYRDIVNLPDPVKLGLTVHYFNHEDVGLYMQITGSCTGYTFGTVNLDGGAVLGSGANKYENLDEFASRAKPSSGDLPDGEMVETVTLILKAYTDAGYSDLKWTFKRVVNVHWINSADAAFTVDELDNFDDGTVQGWGVTEEVDTPAGKLAPNIAVAVDYVLSASYSLKGSHDWTAGAQGAGTYYPQRFRLDKNFTTPDKSKVFGIIDVRLSRTLNGNVENRCRKFQVKKDDDVLVSLGEPTSANVDAVPVNKWMRIVVPLPADSTFELRLVLEWRITVLHDTTNMHAYIWLDDFKIISK